MKISKVKVDEITRCNNSLRWLLICVSFKLIGCCRKVIYVCVATAMVDMEKLPDVQTRAQEMEHKCVGQQPKVTSIELVRNSASFNNLYSYPKVTFNYFNN